MNSNRADGRIGPKAQIENAKADAKADAAQRKIPSDPAPAANNNNSQGDNPGELINKINTIYENINRSNTSIHTFFDQTEKPFIDGLRDIINTISTNLATINIENETNRLGQKTEQLRQVADQLRQQVQQLSETNTQITQARDRLNADNQQLSRDNQQLVQTSQGLRDDIANREQIIRDATASLSRFDAIISTITEDANTVANRQPQYDVIKRSLNDLSNLVNTKLEVYKRLQDLEKQGGMRSKGKRRTKKYKKMRGGYSYPSAGYEGAQEIVVTSSRSAKSRSRSSSRRQSKRRPRTI